MEFMKSLLQDVLGFFPLTDAQRGQQEPSPGEQDWFAYPWDKSNLKSIPRDKQQFEKIDAYARAVKMRDVTTLATLVGVLLQVAHSDLEKVRAIWMWICHNIEYDSAKTSSKPADVFQSRKCVCAGYAALFEEMCSIAGIGCKYLTGYAKRYSYKEGSSFKDKRHAWNAVHIDGRWHLLDCTWGSGFVEDGKFTFSYNEFYFLTHPAVFINDHFPKDSKWQLLKPALSEQEFGSSDRQSPSFFSQQLSAKSQGTSGIKKGFQDCGEQKPFPVEDLLAYLRDKLSQKSAPVLLKKWDSYSLKDQKRLILDVLLDTLELQSQKTARLGTFP